jgi:hypothetical protein
LTGRCWKVCENGGDRCLVWTTFSNCMLYNFNLDSKMNLDDEKKGYKRGFFEPIFWTGVETYEKYQDTWY